MADVYKAVLARLNERTLAVHSNATLHAELQQTVEELLELKQVMTRVREVQSAGLQLAQGEHVLNPTPQLVIDIHTLQQQLASKMRRLVSPEDPESVESFATSHEPHNEALVAEDNDGPTQEVASIAIDLSSETSEDEEVLPAAQDSMESEDRIDEGLPSALNLREQRTLGSIHKKIAVLVNACLDLREHQVKKSRGTRLRCVVFDFERICDQTMGSRSDRITTAIATHPDLLTSVQILVDRILTLKSKVLSAAAAERLLQPIARIPTENEALHSAFDRYETLLADHVKKTRKMIKTSTDPAVCCQSALEFVQDIRQQPIARQENQIWPMLDRLQRALELCEFNGWYTADKTGNQMKTLSCVFEIIVDILMACSTKKIVARKTDIQNLYNDVEASSERCHAFGKLIKSSMKRLQELLNHSLRPTAEIASGIEASSAGSERSHPLRESVKTAVANTSKWRCKRFKLERFDEIMDSLTAVMQYSDRDWNPQTDTKVRECLLKMQKRSIWITEDDDREARQYILADWISSLTQSS